MECTAGENTTMVNAGEMAEMTADGAIEVSAFTAWDVPAFVAEEMKTDEALSETVPAASGIDAAGDLQSAYRDIFATIEHRGGETVFAEEIDFEVDGNPELLVIYTDEEGYYCFRIIRKGTNFNDSLCGWSKFASTSDVANGASCKISLVESGGRLFVCRYWEYGSLESSQGQGNSYSYWGSTAQNDGDKSYWGRIDLVWRHRLKNPEYTYQRCGLSENGLREGAYEDSTAGEFETVPAQYTEVRVLWEE